MSKKVRKTRKEKEFVRHNFKEARTSSNKIVPEDNTEIQTVSKRKVTNVNSFVYTDLKKVFAIILVIIFVLIIFTLVAHQTHYFDFIFNRFGVHY